MKLTDEFSIQYSGLGLGTHEFDWKITDKFFEELEFSEIKKGEVDVHIVLEKRPSFMELHFEIDGEIELECDRCSVEFGYEISSDERLIVKFEEDGGENESEEVIVLGKNDYQLDLSHHLYEFIAVQVPIRKVGCELNNDDSLCDQNVLKLLDNLAPKTEEKTSDPRWDKLSGLELN
ncbi:MAG: DUF177 domain-containing protein [Bacteroidia bacterium]|nr:DUF177 domain-containing protein [Bacteroidia bacterium]